MAPPSSRVSPFTPRGSIRGQTTIYLFSTLAMMMLLALWLFDSNTLIVSSIRAQNAADASALAAAQWQARSLNAIGEINLIKAINNLLDNVPPGVDITGMDYTNAFTTVQVALDSLQSRLTYEGPILAMLAAQQAAKNNGMPVSSLFTQTVRNHAELVETTYQDNFSSGGWNTSDWAEKYAKMLNYIANEGVVVQNGNAKFYYGSLSAGAMASSYLLSKQFYGAIALKDWCGVEDLLTGASPYTDYTYWGLVSVQPQQVAGCEYYNLGLEFTSDSGVTGSLTPDQLSRLETAITTGLDQRSLMLTTNWPSFDPPIQWATYSSSVWSSTNWITSSMLSCLVAGARPGYDCTGCDAVTSVSLPTTITLGLTNRSGAWTSWLVGSENQQAFSTSVSRLESSTSLAAQAYAAARPFGVLSNTTDVVTTFRVVLPVFDNVRLITRSLASWGEDDSDATWLTHKLEHLPTYTQSGLEGLTADCYYCQQLNTWEDPSFRQEGTDWLTETDPDTGDLMHPCIRTGGGPGPGTGGAPFAH